MEGDVLSGAGRGPPHPVLEGGLHLRLSKKTNSACSAVVQREYESDSYTHIKCIKELRKVVFGLEYIANIDVMEVPDVEHSPPPPPVVEPHPLHHR